MPVAVNVDRGCKPRVGLLMSHLFLLCLVVKSEDHHILHTLCIASVAWAISPAILFHIYAVVYFSFITSHSLSSYLSCASLLPYPVDVSSDSVIVLFESNG